METGRRLRGFEINAISERDSDFSLLQETETIELQTINGDDVVNTMSYNVYVSFKDNYWINEGRYFTSSVDRTLKLDLLSTDIKLNKEVEHLPEEEIKRFKLHKRLVGYAYTRLTKYYQEAIGQKITKKDNGVDISDKIILQNRKADIIDKFAKMYSIEEVYKIIVSEWGLNVGIAQLEEFRKNNIDTIIRLQKEFTNNFNEVRLAHKHSRLLEYMFLYNETKESYTRTRSKEDRKFLVELLSNIKKEAEGDIIRIEGNVNLNIEQTLNVFLHKTIMQKLPINEMILSRVAARININPYLLLYRLQKSYYSKYTGFLSTGEEGNNFAPEYPSSVTYDLDKLISLNKKNNAEFNNKKEFFDDFIDVPETIENKTQVINEKSGAIETIIETNTRDTVRNIILKKLKEINANNKKN